VIALLPASKQTLIAISPQEKVNQKLKCRFFIVS